VPYSVSFTYGARTVDKLFTVCDPGRMTGKSKRPSKLGKVQRQVTFPQSGERVIAEERLRRRAVDEAVGNVFQYKSVKAYRRVVAARKKVEGVRPDDEVSSDASTAVEEESADWQLRWVLADQDGGLVARSLHIEAKGRRTPPGGITANLLRELSPSSVAAAAADVSGIDSFSAVLMKHARRAVSEDLPSPAPHRKGRPPLSDEYLATVAVAYLEELPKGRGVLGRLADRFDREPATMRDQVRIARDRHFLTDAPSQGRKGGGPGSTLLAFLAEREGQPEGEVQS
jgi:hypothetical protein